MKTSSLAILKKELLTLPQEEVMNVCLRLLKYKVENKELVHYLLFEAKDEESFIEKVKEEVSVEIEKINYSNYYFVRKTIKRVLKLVKKQIKYSGSKKTEVELMVFVCQKFKEKNIDSSGNIALENLYSRQLKNINKVLGSLHEDLQYDYKEQIDNL